MTPGRVREGLVPRLFALGSGALVLLWAGGAAAMANRGIDLSDESFYLLSYRWWDNTPRTFSGTQFLYGPVFELFGYDVAALRIFRLATVLGAHVWFAFAFLRWLDVSRPGGLSGPWRRVALLAIVASGGVTYGWLPLSPGYNDVAALGSMMMLGCVLVAAATARRTGRLPWLPAVALGPLAVALVMAKWASAGVVLLFLVAVGVIVTRQLGARGLIRFAGVGLASTAGTVVLVGFLVGGYGQVLPQVLEVNRLVASETNSPADLIVMYVESGLELLARALLVVLLAGVLLGAAALLSRRGRGNAAGILVALAPPSALLVLFPSGFGLPGGGADRVTTYSSCLVAMALLVAVAVLAGRRRRYREGRSPDVGPAGPADDRAVILALLLLPVVQALGTGNGLYYLAVSQFACWTALMVLGIVSLPTSRRVLAVSAASCAVVVAATTGFGGVALNPYRTSGFAEADTVIGGRGPLSGIRVSSAESDKLATVRRVVEQAVGANAGRSVMAFDELAGLVLLLDGRSVGEAWYSAIAPERSAVGIEDACTAGPPWGDRLPVLIFSRPVLAVDRQALASCDLDLSTGYTVTVLTSFDPVLSIYLPRGSAVDE